MKQVAFRAKKLTKKLLVQFKMKFSGQKLEKEQEEALQNLDPNAPLSDKLFIKHRRALGFIIPIIFWQSVWWTLAISVGIIFADNFDFKQV